MDWVQFFGLLVPIVALFGFLYKELKEWRQDRKWREYERKLDSKQEEQIDSTKCLSIS